MSVSLLKNFYIDFKSNSPTQSPEDSIKNEVNYTKIGMLKNVDRIQLMLINNTTMIIIIF